MKTGLLFAVAVLTAILMQLKHSAFGAELNAGDIAIIAVSSNEPKSFDFITLAKISAGTTIYFTDDAWITDSSGFRGGEGTISYTFTKDTDAGSLFYWEEGASGFDKTGSFNLSASGDNLLCFQNTDNPSFIYGTGWAKNTTGNWQFLHSSSGATATSDIPPGLSAADMTISYYGTMDSYAYTAAASHTGSRSELLYVFSIPDNFDGDDDLSLNCMEQNFAVEAGSSTEEPAASQDTASSSAPIEDTTQSTTQVSNQVIVICPDGEEINITQQEYESLSKNILQSQNKLILSSTEGTVVKEETVLPEIIETKNGLSTADGSAVNWYCDNMCMGISEECAILTEGTYYFTYISPVGCTTKSDALKVSYKTLQIHFGSNTEGSYIYVDMQGRVSLNKPPVPHIKIPR